MKLVKPMVVSFGYRTFRMLGRQFLAVTSLVAFALEEKARRLVSEIPLWEAIGAVTPGSIDEGLPKPRGEVLLFGSCHAPGGRPLAVSEVRLRVAPASSADAGPGEPRAVDVDKRLVVFGDRYWAGTAVQGSSNDRLPTSREASAPVPFLEMPLGWERSFGGEGFPHNPLGRGMARIDVGDGIERLPLPNVEDKSNLINASTQRPEPVGFGPLDLSWPQRRSKAGTYDARWLEEDFPGYARDTDPAFFSAAPPDQRIDGFFRGDEQYLLENLHPQRPLLRGQLPGVTARVLLRRKDVAEAEDVPTRLDTIVFLPGQEIGVLVFRGLTHVIDDEAADVTHALAACEELGAPRSTPHYAAALQRRLNKDQSPLLALREDDLVPHFARATGLAELFRSRPRDGEPDPAKAPIDEANAEVREQLAAAGVAAPEEALAGGPRMPPGLEPLAKLPDLSDPESVAAYEAALEKIEAFGKDQVEEAERAKKEAIEEMRQQGHVVPTPSGGPGPPTPMAPEVLANLREAGSPADAAMEAKLHAADAKILDGYRETAHYAEPVAPLSAEAQQRARGLTTERRAAGGSFAAMDCTRYDLAGLDLTEADFREALLEGADLTGANLARGDASRAVLALSLIHI